MKRTHRTYKLFILLFATALLLSNCSPAHVMNPHNVPGFTQAKETKISGSISNQDIFIGIAGHLNFAYSFSDKFAFIGGGSLAQTGWSTMYYSNIGLGYYKPFQTNMVFENYLGYGNGSTKDNLARDYRHFKARYTSVFNQSSLTIRNENGTLEGVLSLRLSNIHHYDIVDYYVYDDNQTNLLVTNPDTFLIEPSFILRAGVTELKFEAYLNFLTPISNREQETYGYFSRTAMGIGLVYSFKPKEEINR